MIFDKKDNRWQEIVAGTMTRIALENGGIEACFPSRKEKILFSEVCWHFLSPTEPPIH